jgi:hypothetical protein
MHVWFAGFGLVFFLFAATMLLFMFLRAAP